jgi:hypothetical protein
MAQRKGTQMTQQETKKVRIAANVEADIAEMIDRECMDRRCSRADVIRWAVLDRNAERTTKSKRKAS